MSDFTQVISDRFVEDYSKQNDLNDGRSLVLIIMYVLAICGIVLGLPIIWSSDIDLDTKITRSLIDIVLSAICIGLTFFKSWATIKVPRYNNCSELYLYENEYVATYDWKVKKVETDKSKYTTLSGKNKGTEYYLYFGNMVLQIDSDEFDSLSKVETTSRSKTPLIITAGDIAKKRLDINRISLAKKN